MRRLMLSGLSVLLISAVAAPTLRAETAALNPTILNSTSTSATPPTPFNLVSLAHRGYFQRQGIPSYLGLTSAYHAGQIEAVDIVQAAVKANRLSADFLANEGYLAAVEAQLRELENIR